MSERSRQIEAAVRRAKHIHGRQCVVRDEEGRRCNRGPVDGAHLIPRNVSFPDWDPRDVDGIRPLCRHHHNMPGGYDDYHSIEGKLEWLIKHGLIEEAEYVSEITGIEVPTRVPD